MASEESRPQKSVYRSLEEFQHRFYGTTEGMEIKASGEADEGTAFGKELAKEFARRAN